MQRSGKLSCFQTESGENSNKLHRYYCSDVHDIFFYIKTDTCLRYKADKAQNGYHRYCCPTIQWWRCVMTLQRCSTPRICSCFQILNSRYSMTLYGCKEFFIYTPTLFPHLIRFRKTPKNTVYSWRFRRNVFGRPFVSRQRLSEIWNKLSRKEQLRSLITAVGRASVGCEVKVSSINFNSDTACKELENIKVVCIRWNTPSKSTECKTMIVFNRSTL